MARDYYNEYNPTSTFSVRNTSTYDHTNFRPRLPVKSAQSALFKQVITGGLVVPTGDIPTILYSPFFVFVGAIFFSFCSAAFSFSFFL